MIFLKLDRANKRSLSIQIYNQIRNKILSGDLRKGDSLPTTREASIELSVARNTVLVAYDMLIAEGLAYSLPRAGVYVSGGAKANALPVQLQDYQTASLADVSTPESVISFDSGIPALELFPRAKWNRTVTREFLDAPVSALGYDNPQGRPELRGVLCQYLKRTRGISCSPEQILITSGTKQGLNLVAKCLLNSESEVWLEEPTNRNVRQIFSYYTEHLVPFKVDQDGIRPDEFPPDGKPALIFVTPSHQFPMGACMPIQRRLALINFARQTGCLIVEDDYDNEFRYDGLPVNSLFELDSERVIYTGTFSKILFPSLRLGYLVLPQDLVAKMRELKRLSDHHSNSIDQLALMRFIESGDLERHIRKMKKEYKKRRDRLQELLKERFGDRVSLHGGQSGIYVVAEFDGVRFDNTIIQRLFDSGVHIVPVAAHAMNGERHISQIILGYAHLTDDKMLQGIRILEEQLRA